MHRRARSYNSATVGQRRNKQQRYKRHPELFYSNNDALQVWNMLCSGLPLHCFLSTFL